MATSSQSMTVMICLLVLIIGAHQVAAQLVQASCANYNTGLDFAYVTDDYQSNGKCFDTCKSSYAFAVVQDKSCWCSNYAPADSVDVGSCSEECPGYGYENCGSLADGLYGYVALSKKPSGTIGASTSSPSISTSSTTPIVTSTQPVTSALPAPSTIAQTQAALTSIPPKSLSTATSITPSTAKSTPTTPVAPIVPEKTSPTSTSTSQASAPTSTWSPTPSPSVITVAGAPTTIYVTPTSPPVETAAAQTKNSSGGFINNKSAVAGVFTTLGLIVVALISLAVWLLLRRRRRRGAITIASIDGGETPQRRPSRLSQMGLVGTNRSSMHGIQTSGPGMSTHGDVSADLTPITPRASSGRVVDQRLDPSSLWEPLRNNNGSHASLHSVQDNRDYSRRILGVTNP